MTSERCGFMRNSLHHAAVSAQCINSIVKHLESRPIEVSTLPARCDRHADTSGDALTQRAGCGFYPRSPAIFGMTGTPAIELAEVPDVVERNAWLTGRFIFRINGLNSGEVY